MKDEPSSSSRQGRSASQPNWLEKLGQAFGGNDPQNLDQILEVLRDAQERGLFDLHALAMVEGVFEVTEMRVRDIMIPRSHMTVLEQGADFGDVLNILTESGHSRFPVIAGDRDELVGVLLAKDVLKYAGRPEEFALDDILRQVVIIPESKRLITLLNEFRSSRNHLAMVVDEYGGVSGLVTIEDVLEVIVGEIDDEHDSEEDHYIRPHRKGHYTVHALTEIEEFNAFFKTTLSDEDADTIGGYVMRLLGHVPKRGEQVESEGILFTVLGADSRRIYRLKVTTEESLDEPTMAEADDDS
ncbi:CBS domain containing protein [gamma proteobacterium HTCC5015]|nr:CBS domain containing protein [gamma proteobacterium HTCC5015]